MLSEAKIARWWKEQALVKSLAVVRSPSRRFSPSQSLRIIRLMFVALSSEISIRTISHLNSPTCAQGELYNNSLLEPHNLISLRLLDAAQHLNQVIDAQRARSVFNDVQQLLETRNSSVEDGNGYKWRPELETNLVQIRNLMNLHSKVMVGSQSNCESLSKYNARHNMS
jgi:hypothetical protein